MIPALQEVVVNVSVGHAGDVIRKGVGFESLLLEFFHLEMRQRISYLIVNTRDVNYAFVDVVITSIEV